MRATFTVRVRVRVRVRDLDTRYRLEDSTRPTTLLLFRCPTSVTIYRPTSLPVRRPTSLPVRRHLLSLTHCESTNRLILNLLSDSTRYSTRYCSLSGCSTFNSTYGSVYTQEYCDILFCGTDLIRRRFCAFSFFSRSLFAILSATQC